MIGCLCRLFVIIAVRKPTGLAQHSCVPLGLVLPTRPPPHCFCLILCLGVSRPFAVPFFAQVLHLWRAFYILCGSCVYNHLRPFRPFIPHVSRVPPPPPPTPPPKSSVSLFARRFCVFISLIVFLVVLGNLHTFLLEVRSAGNVCLFRVGSCCHFGSSDSSVWREKIPRANPVTWFDPEYDNDLGIPCFAGSGAQFRVFWLPLFFISAIHGGSAGTMTAPRDISFTLLQSPRLPRLARCPFCQFRAFFAAWDRPTLLICLNSVRI